ncbi:MAG: hypothetical protein AB7E49_10305 [Campylobacterales bacterium]
MFSSKINADSINLLVVNIPSYSLLEYINDICVQAEKIGLSFSFIESQYTPNLSSANKKIDKRIFGSNKRNYFIQVKDKPDFKLSEIMFTACHYPGAKTFLGESEKREIDVFVSLHGLVGYGDSNFRGKFLIVQGLIKHFGDRVILNRLDIAFDYRPTKTNLSVSFDKFSVKRFNHHYTANPNSRIFDGTFYIESRYSFSKSESVNSHTGQVYNKKIKKSKPYYSFYYDKSKKEAYPYGIFRHELIFNRSKLKGFGLGSITQVLPASCEKLVRYVDKCQYVNYYDSVSWQPPIKGLGKFLAWLFEYLNDRCEMGADRKRAYESAESSFLDAKRVERIAKSPKMKRAGGALNITLIAKEAGVGREFARKVLEKRHNLTKKQNLC